MSRLSAEALGVREVLLSLERAGVHVTLADGKIVATGNLAARGADAGLETLRGREKALAVALEEAAGRSLEAAEREREELRRAASKAGRDAMRRRWHGDAAAVETPTPARGPHRRTICARGHSLEDPANVYTSPRGHRHCRVCARERERRRAAAVPVVSPSSSAADRRFASAESSSTPSSPPPSTSTSEAVG